MKVKSKQFIKKAYLVNTKQATKYNKLQLWIAKRFKLALKYKYFHLYHIDYKGHTRLKKDDLIVVNDKYTLVITEERNWQAMAVTVDERFDPPRIAGAFRIERKSEKTK